MLELELQTTLRSLAFITFQSVALWLSPLISDVLTKAAPVSSGDSYTPKLSLSTESPGADTGLNNATVVNVVSDQAL